MTERILEILNDAIRNRIFPGCAAAIVYKGRKPRLITTGHFTYDSDSHDIEPESIFDVASVTKAIPVSCIALKLIEQGKMRGDDPLKKFVREYRSNYKDSVTIDNLLTHTLDFDFRLSRFKDCGAPGILDAVLGAELKSPPGDKFCYANATSILLGLAIESCSGERLDKIAEKMFFGGMQMWIV